MLSPAREKPVVVVEWSDSKTRELEKGRMLFFTFILLLGCASVFADGHSDSKGCCEYKRVPGNFNHCILTKCWF